MPVISMFYGIIVLIYYFDNRLMADWRLATSSQSLFKIEPLK
jgi:hypothetical protein